MANCFIPKAPRLSNVRRGWRANFSFQKVQSISAQPLFPLCPFHVVEDPSGWLWLQLFDQAHVDAAALHVCSGDFDAYAVAQAQHLTGVFAH